MTWVIVVSDTLWCELRFWSIFSTKPKSSSQLSSSVEVRFLVSCACKRQSQWHDSMPVGTLLICKRLDFGWQSLPILFAPKQGPKRRKPGHVFFFRIVLSTMFLQLISSIFINFNQFSSYFHHIFIIFLLSRAKSSPFRARPSLMPPPLRSSSLSSACGWRMPPFPCCATLGRPYWLPQ